MPKLAAPPDKKRTVALRKTAPRQQRLTEKLARWGYFLGAVLFHLILFIVLATWVVFPPPPPPASDFKQVYVPEGITPPTPPQSSPPTMPVPTRTVANLPMIANPNAGDTSFHVPLPDFTPATVTHNNPTIAAPEVKGINNLNARLGQIKKTEKLWGRTTQNIFESGGDPHAVVAKFPIYLASYAGGDWHCNVHFSSGSIDAGSIFNLVTKTNEWSQGKITGNVVSTPLVIAGPDLLSKMPPFVFFTGHQDFILTDAEIQNLRDYLQNGGAIWGDNALPGEGSPFDIAFRREMKRVIPDKDIHFEALPMSHDIFTRSWFHIDRLPPGMNYCAEPIQHLDLDGRISILYTPNDYSDLFLFHIQPGDATGGPLPGKPNEASLQKTFFNDRDLFFRNFQLDGALSAQQLGMNILTFLLVRFDKDISQAP